MGLVSKLNDNSTIRVPEEIIKKAGLKPGDDMIWYFDENSKQILISEKPKSFAKELKGLGKDVWKDVDPVKYVQEERSSW